MGKWLIVVKVLSGGHGCPVDSSNNSVLFWMDCQDEEDFKGDDYDD